MSDRDVVDERGCHTAQKCGVKAKESQDTIPTLYLLLTLFNKPIK